MLRPDSGALKHDPKSLKPDQKLDFTRSAGTHRPVSFLRLLVDSTLLLGLAGCIVLAAGCVAVTADSALDVQDLPPDHAAVFVAVPFAAPGSSGGDVEVRGSSHPLRLVFDETHIVHLQTEAVNRIYLPEGWYRMELPELAQPDDNSVMRYRFEAGDVYRFTISARPTTAPDTLAPGNNLTELKYTVTATTRNYLEALLIEDAYPVIDQK